ncbi:MAG: hypothetical protein HDR35_10290 [Treponema sp.]|nr:hypothetical protein [Treponema sp.]
MRGNSLSFFKPPVFVKTILLSCAFFASMFFNSCKQLTSFDPNVDGVRVAVSNTFSAPTDLKATHGRKQMISLEWTPVSGAKYYDIYCAESATAEFKKIGGTDKNSFDDRVGAGRTLYYRVCATKSDGTQSEFSATVKGTSLAQPVISGGDVEADSATISWFMENARAVDGTDNYESSLMFVVHWQQKNGGTPNEETLSAKEDFKNSFYEHKIENLSGAADYEFWIDAYLSGDQSSVESSPRVDKKTLTSYTPLAPVFTASQGESAKGIWLYITLPEKVMVQTETKLSPNEKVDEPYPLYFKIYRKVGEMGEGDSDADWGSPVCERLYCNIDEKGHSVGTTTPPAEADYAEAYNVGAEIKWLDESANLVGGEKYTYRIISFVDTNYSKVVCPDDKQYDGSASTPPNKVTTALGWKSAHPDFKVNYSADSRTLSPDKTKVLSVSFGFDAGWKDLGKAGDYKFAIKQNKKPWKENYTGNGEDSWLNNASGEPFFDTIDEIKSCAVKFGSESDLKAEEGVYSYTLYVVLKDAAIGDVTDGGEKVLDSVKATDEIVVTDVVELPKAELEVQGGYKDKVVLKITVEQGVTYKVVRTRLDTTPQDVKEFEITVPENHGASFEYSDSVEGNGRYSYMLKAIATNGAFSLSPSQEAETLGTPKVSFEKGSLSYDSVTISFDGVLAAERYAVQLGTSGGFGGGATFDITKSGDGWVKEAKYDEATANVTFVGNKFTVTINKPKGYDDATKAGAPAKLTVTAYSNVNDAPSEAVDVNVLGPALLNAEVNKAAEATENSITLTWKKVDGTKGYLIRRVMYSDAGMKNVAENSDVTYYYEVATGSITTDGDAPNDSDVRVKVEPSDASFKLTDTYKEANPNAEVSVQIYQEAQAKIAWGLPFRYVVLPVLDKGDFDFASKSLALADSGNKVPYSNIDKIETKEAATFGYGLNLVADKATSGTTQHIKWDVPNNLKETQTVFYRRMYTTDGKRDNEFERILNVSPNNTDATILVEKDNLCNAFEYIVKYYEKGVSPSPNIRLPDSLFDEIARQKEEPRITSRGEKIEQKNKGYLLAVDFNTIPHPNPNSQQKYTYAEQISWTPWDYDIRAVGPETMELTLRNYNIDAEEHGVFLITTDKTTGRISVDLKKIDDDTDVEEADFVSVYNITSKSLVNGKGTASGMLKVLRDSPHYTLTLKNGEETVSYEKGAHRHITCEELVRAATLAMAYGIQKTGTDWATVTNSRDNTYGESSPGHGTAIVKNVGGSVSWDKLIHYFTFTNFTPAMPTKAGEKAVFLTVNGTMTGTTGSGGSLWQHYAPKTYTDGSFTVSAAEDGELYKATITISSLTVNGTSGLKISYSDGGGEKEFGNITPFVFGNGNGKYDAKPLEDGVEEWQ